MNETIESLTHDLQTLAVEHMRVLTQVDRLTTDTAKLIEEKEELAAKLQAAEELIGMLNEIADDYATHDSWRCGYYDECHCGLNELQKLAGMELSPCGYNKPTEEALRAEASE